MYKLAYRALAPEGQRSRLTVLIYHRVLPAHDPLRPSEPTEAEFERRMRWVKSHFNVLPLRDAVRALQANRLPERPLAITFDDGYADNHDHALPVLRRLGLPATFFVATGYLDGGRMFNDTVIESVRQTSGPTLDLRDVALGNHRIESVGDRLAAVAEILDKIKYLPLMRRDEVADAVAQHAGARMSDDLMMTSAQVAALHRAGMEIGGHTVGHPILTEVDFATARDEIVVGRTKLESITGSPVDLFAYPNGRPGRDYSSEHVALVKSLGFRAAVSTQWGTAGYGADVFQIPRFTPWDSQQWKFGLRIAWTLARSGYAPA